MPYRHRINHLFQKYITKGVRLSDEYMEDKLIHFQKHCGFFTKYGHTADGKQVLELGTGWYPIVPLCFFLSGASRITTVDISPLLTSEKLRQSIQKLIKWKEEGRLQKFLQPDPDRWSLLYSLGKHKGMPLAGMLAALQTDYLVCDARKLPLSSATIDLIVSNNTFEHIYPEILEKILLEFKRVLNPGGMMSHFIDLSDHFAHLDTSITIYNFLRFSSLQWRVIDNAIQPQNRWRINHYRELYVRLGIEVVSEENRPGDILQLRNVPVHPSFSHILEKDLAVSHSYLVSHG